MLSVRLLGPVRASVDAREIALGPPLQRAVFTVLAVRRDQVVDRGELIDAVWGEALPGNPEGAVHTYVAGLRRALEPVRARRSPGRFLESHPSGYRLRLPDPEATDLARFERLADEGRAASGAGRLPLAERLLDEALALFDGSVLGGVPGPFAQARREWLAAARQSLAEDRAEVLLARRRFGAAAAEARRLADAEPLRERPWALLMTALYRDGRQAEALAAYDRARAVSAEQLGLDPGPLLGELRQRIVVADPSLLPGGPREAEPGERWVDLPRDSDHFTGRTAEAARVVAAAGRGVCAIDGMAGVGKTTLAVHVAQRLAGRCPDVRLYIDLHGHTPGRRPVTAAAALERLLLAVGVPGERIPAGAEDRAALWRSRLAGRRALLVLDNAVDTGQVRPLLPGSASCLVVITSRRRLTGLDAGESVSLDVLPFTDALALFAAVAGPDRVAAEPAATEAVLRACGLLPLAVQISAARLRHRPAWTVAHLRDRLAVEERRLDELAAEDRSVEAAFALSYRSLATGARRMFRLLGLFPGAELGLAAAAALCGVDVVAADRLLEGLVDCQLLDEPRPGRYRLHDLLRAYAARECCRTESADERAAALARLADFYLATVDGAEQLLRPQRLDRADPSAPRTGAEFGDRAAALAWLDAERGVFAPLVETAARIGRHRQAWQLARCLWGFFEARGHWTDWICCHELALPSARLLGDRLAEARLLVGLGVAEHRLRNYPAAVSHYRNALALMREAGFRSGEAGVLTNLGNTLRRMGRTAEAIECQEQSLAGCQAIPDQAGEAIALANLGDLYRDAGRLRKSLAAQEQALAMFRKWGERRWEGSVLDGLARTHLAAGATEPALVHCREALECRRACGDRAGEAETLDTLGRIHLRRGDLAPARSALTRALAVAQALDTPLADDIRRRLARISGGPPSDAENNTPDP
ncbi:AfsR/SARP family transcriptional regulator [Actinacidiphila acidipaludis]|uniref:Tetratricopeptide repeat protein n=1 Tax=Actinacidiphila acidipaludis TaxID=2873382 RepID=A0ABS7Q6I1_9ACTN|nr:BTAD domain-containing putative transcriptional regulator [Streptomyces acidipaludis]MBY8878751.1 tetratricopeptide repeat protein [Streptomyces acidipaludis]